jgi:uncharacterized membrane protein
MGDDQKKGSWLGKVSELFLPAIVIIGLILVLEILMKNPVIELSPMIPYEKPLTSIVGYIVLAAEATAALVIGIAMLHALIGYFRHLFDRTAAIQINASESIRLRLGHMLNLGLEFAVASDILRLVIAPSAQDILILFAIIMLRVLLNFILEHDIETIQMHKKDQELDKSTEEK